MLVIDVCVLTAPYVTHHEFDKLCKPDFLF